MRVWVRVRVRVRFRVRVRLRIDDHLAWGRVHIRVGLRARGRIDAHRQPRAAITTALAALAALGRPAGHLDGALVGLEGDGAAHARLAQRLDQEAAHRAVEPA